MVTYVSRNTHVGFLALLVMAITGVLVVFASGARRPCVALENGLNLGVEAAFDLSRPLFRPIAVPRFSDGTPLIREETWGLYITDTSVYGLTMFVEDEQNFSFAWNEGSGFVRKHENEQLYDRILTDAGPANWDFGTGAYGSATLMRWLEYRAGRETKLCPTAWVTW